MAKTTRNPDNNRDMNRRKRLYNRMGQLAINSLDSYIAGEYELDNSYLHADRDLKNYGVSPESLELDPTQKVLCLEAHSSLAFFKITGESPKVTEVRTLMLEAGIPYNQTLEENMVSVFSGFNGRDVTEVLTRAREEVGRRI